MKIPWRRKWQPSPVFLPGEFHGQSSLAGYSPWGRKELDTTERLTHTHVNRYLLNNISSVLHTTADTIRQEEGEEQRMSNAMYSFCCYFLSEDYVLGAVFKFLVSRDKSTTLGLKLKQFSRKDKTPIREINAVTGVSKEPKPAAPRNLTEATRQHLCWNLRSE